MYSLNLNLILLLVLGAHALTEKQFTGNWYHNFNEQDHLDLSEWEIFQDCNGNEKLEQLNCNTNRTKNLDLVDGALALTAVREHYEIKGEQKEVTSAWIETVKGFDFKKIEIRMAMTQGRLLRPVVLLQNLNITYEYPARGQINFVSYTHGKQMTRGMHANWGNKQNNYVGAQYKAKEDESLQEFQVYSVERNDTHLVWKFNDRVQLEFDLRQNWNNGYNPFAPGNFFYITINLGVGGKTTTGGPHFFSGSQDVIEASNTWKCSSFLIDYIKVIGRDGQDDPMFVKPQTKSASDICKEIMYKLRSEHGLEIGTSSGPKLTNNFNIIIITLALSIIFRLRI